MARYLLVILPLFIATLLRAQIPIGDAAALQLTVPLLLAMTGWLFWETQQAVARDNLSARAAPVLAAHR